MTFLTRRELAYLATRPREAIVVARAGWRLRRAAWWRRAPFLPLPDERYWAFRMLTAFGSAPSRATPAQLVDAARWSMRQRVGK